jgi:hypothetical protein
MRVLLDESLPRPLGRLLAEHIVRTVAEEGWAGLENGELLRTAAARFDVILTADQISSFNRTLRPFRLR